MGLFLSLAWRNLWRNRRRTLITFAAIGVGVWSMITLAALMNAWAASTFQTAINTLTGHGQIHAQNYRDDPGVEHAFPRPTGELKALLDADAVKSWAARVQVPAIVQSERNNAPVTLVGIDPMQERGLSFIADAVNEGRYLIGADEHGILLGHKLAQRLHTGLGKRVVLLSQGRDGNIAERGFRIVGIFSADQAQSETRYVFIPRGQAQTMLGMGDEISEVSFILNNLDTLPDFLDQLRVIAPELDIVAWFTLEPFTQAILDISTGTIALWTVVMFILVAFGLVNTLLMAVYERTREFGLLQALGLRPRLILLLVLLESLMLIGIGVAAGLASGAVTVLAFHDGLEMGALAEGATMFGAGRVLYPQLDLSQSLIIALFVWGMGVVTSLYPAWRAARQAPAATINKL